MAKYRWFLLQLFADGGTGGEGGGEGSETGDTAADAGQQRLRELGVPESKIRKNRAYKLGNAPTEAVRKAAGSEQSKSGDAAPTEVKKETPTEEEKPSGRMTWDEIKADPEYNKEIQNLIRARLKESGASREAMEAMGPALELLAKSYGLDANQIDYKALSAKIVDDNKFYEDKAVEMGTSVETVKKLEQQGAELARFRQQQAQTLEMQAHARHIAGLEQQGEELKKIFPSFDLQTELKNPVFARMTAPNGGVPVKNAYYAVHAEEIQNAHNLVVAQQTAKQMANSIKANAARPDESGSQQGSSQVTFDYSKASRAQREELKKRIRSGERIVPGREFG